MNNISGWATLDLYFDFFHKDLNYIEVALRLYVIFQFYFIKSLFRSNFLFSQRQGNIKAEPRPPSSSLQSRPNPQQLSEFFFKSKDRLVVKLLPSNFFGLRSFFKDTDNDKAESLSGDEDISYIIHHHMPRFGWS